MSGLQKRTYTSLTPVSSNVLRLSFSGLDGLGVFSELVWLILQLTLCQTFKQLIDKDHIAERTVAGVLR